MTVEILTKTACTVGNVGLLGKVGVDKKGCNDRPVIKVQGYTAHSR